MRRIVTFNNVSADGYFTGPGGNLDWVVPDEKIYKAAAENGPALDTIQAAEVPRGECRRGGRFTHERGDGYARRGPRA